MNNTLNKIIHFQGSEQTWKNNIVNGEWTSNIVFGLVKDQTGVYSKRFYGGRDSRNNEYEIKSSITVTSLAIANELVSIGNVGLFVGVINPIMPAENGTYVIEYGQDDNIKLTKVSNEIEIDAQTLYPIFDPSNRITSQDTSALEAIDKSAEGVNIKITEDSSNEQHIKVGIDLDKIYLPHGIQRTEAIGVLPASEEIVTEGVGMSVKELLEYYLVAEKFPNVSTYTGIGVFDNFSLTVNNLPNNISTYITINGDSVSDGALVEIGSTLSINEISGTLTCTRSAMQETITSTQSKITGMNFGYCTIVGVNNEPAGTISDSSIIIAEPGVATATYSIKDSDLYVQSTLTVNSTQHRSSSLESSYLHEASSVDVSEGNNIISLSLTHDAAATRELSNTQIPGILPSVYIISNKNKVYSEMSAKVENSSISGSTIASVNNYTTTSYSVIGVYPIFTNGKSVETDANLSEFNWYNNQYSIDPSNKLPLVNYLNSNQTYIISFGTSADGNKCYIWVPEGMSFTVPQACELDANENINAWSNNTTRSQSWIKDGSTSINVQGNEVVYDRYYDDTRSAGKWAFKVQINKKQN